MKSVLRKLLGLLIIATAVAVPLSREADRPVQTLVARWAAPPSQFIELDGQLVHLRDEGPRDDPLPLVLAHGSSSSLHTWDGWVQALKARRRVIRMDLPGFGLTGPSPAAVYDSEADARFVLALLDRLQVQRFVVGGNSLGGEVAWRTALLAPERVDKLILVDASGPVFEAGSMPLAWRLARAPVLNRLLEELLPRALVAQGLASVYADPARITPELVDRYFELTLREGNRRALVQRLQQWRPGEGAERIATLRLPTLILWGGGDRLIPTAVARHFHGAIAGSGLVVLDGLGHAPHEEDPAASLPPVLAFLGLR